MTDMTDMTAIVTEFVHEGTDKADQLERKLIQLEKNPASRELLVEVCRALHTIKGATSFLGFTKLRVLAHDGEKLLVPLRDGKLAPTPEIITALLALVDAIREILSAIASSGSEGTKDYASLSARLAHLQKAPGP